MGPKSLHPKDCTSHTDVLITLLASHTPHNYWHTAPSPSAPYLAADRTALPKDWLQRASVYVTSRSLSEFEAWAIMLAAEQLLSYHHSQADE